MKTVEGPHGRLYLDHNPKSVVLLGMGPSVQDYMVETMTQELKPGHHDEVWGINMVANCFRCDACFWMDDLVSQSQLCPHHLVPTQALKSLFGDGRAEPLRQVGGDRFADLMVKIDGAGDWMRHEDYNWIVEEFKSLVNGALSVLSHQSVAMIISGFNEDLKHMVPDKSRSLAGLINVLARHGTPVITSTRRPEIVPNSTDYPLDEIANLGIKRWGKPYLNNGVAMAIGYAIWKGVKTLKIFGCDFTYPNRNFAEEGRACTESWITYAVERDVQIMLSPHTSLMDSYGDRGIYGYAEQPMIEMPDGQKFKYQKSTELADTYRTIYNPPSEYPRSKDELSSAPQADSATGPRGSDYGAAAIANGPGAIHQPRIADSPSAAIG